MNVPGGITKVGESMPRGLDTVRFICQLDSMEATKKGRRNAFSELLIARKCLQIPFLKCVAIIGVVTDAGYVELT